MADNSTLPVSVGTEVFANDDIAGVKYPRIKNTWGPDGTTNDVDIATGKPMPVQLRGSDGTDRSNLMPVSQSGTWTVQPGNTANTTAWLVNTGIQLNAGAATATTTLFTIDSGQLGALGQTTSSASVPVVLANDHSDIRTVSGGDEYEAIAASQTDVVLGTTTGATGDYLEGILCIVATAATSQVMIGDGATPAIVILPNAVGAGVGSYYVPLGLKSKVGSWRVTTAAGVSVIATGDFAT
jgi:hypothetical protein